MIASLIDLGRDLVGLAKLLLTPPKRPMRHPPAQSEAHTAPASERHKAQEELERSHLNPDRP